MSLIRSIKQASVMVMLGAAGHGMAAGERVENLLEMSLDDLLTVPITVASLHQESHIDAPSTVTSFNRKQIENLGVRSVEELLNYVPGFQSSRETFTNQGYRVGARGLLTPQPSYSILFLIDGQHINSDLSAGALFANRYISTANVERVEIIRGPGSALYGTSAFSGVVNIITTKDTNNLYVGAGNLQSQEVYVNGSSDGEINGAEWRASGFVRSYSDKGQSYDESVTLPVNPAVYSTQDPYSARDAYASLGWSNRVELNLRHSERDLDDFFDYTYVQDGVAQARTRQSSATLIAQLIAPGSARGLVLQTGIFQSEESQVEELGGDLGTYKQQVTEWDMELKGFYAFSTHEVRAGLTYREPKVDSNQFVKMDGSGAIPLGPTDARSISGAYIQDQFQISESLRATLGVRVDHYSDVGSSTSPRAALTYNFRESTGFKVMYGEAFRAPNRFQTSELLFGNEDLVAEEIKTFEVSWLQDYHSWLPDYIDVQTTATWFTSDHENRINLSNLPNSLALQHTNDIDTLKTSGVELEMAAAVGLYSTFRVAYSHLSDTQESPQSFPQRLFSLIANAEVDRWNVNFSAIYRGSTEQPLVGNGFSSLDSYWFGNVNIRYRVQPGAFLVTRIENLTDKAYYSPSEIRLMENGLINRGRTYSLGIQLNL